MSTPAPDAFAPARLGPVAVRNRIVKAATFEGMTAKHVVSDELIAFHKEMAQGGVGMTTVAYCAVSAEGCGTPNEMILTDDAVPGLQKLADVVHAEGAAVSAQIGHAGAVAASTGYPAVSPSPFFSMLAMKRTRGLEGYEIDKVIVDFASAAKRIKDGGFDAVELHLGHGYLISEFLSPKLNQRTDEWGGSLENRARLAREVVKRVRDAVGPDLAVTAKMNMSDGVRGGFWIKESVEVARMLEADGALDAVELTGGSSLENSMYLFRGEAPIEELAASMPKAVGLGLKLFGRFIFKEYPFEEAYFLRYARQFREALSMPLILLGGINQRKTIDQAMTEGFEFVAMGRALLREPDLVNRMAQGVASDSLCVHCNKCMATIYRGTHCVLASDPR